MIIKVVLGVNHYEVCAAVVIQSRTWCANRATERELERQRDREQQGGGGGFMPGLTLTVGRGEGARCAAMAGVSDSNPPAHVTMRLECPPRRTCAVDS
jgi:hypothetical protein